MPPWAPEYKEGENGQCAASWCRYPEEMFIKVAKWVLLIAVLIQFVPFGHTHTNPPETKEPAWNSQDMKALVQRACFDCHSNETAWPWYSNIAPVSWLVARDVHEGRRHMDFSTWADYSSALRLKKLAGISTMVQEGEMPPWFYLPMHANARLSPDDVSELATWADSSTGEEPAPR